MEFPKRLLLRSFCSTILLLIALFPSLVESHGPQIAKDKDQTVRFLQDMEARKRAYKAIRYSLVGTTEFFDKYKEQAQNKPQPLSMTIIFDIENKRLMYEKREQAPVQQLDMNFKLATRVTKKTFDGKSMHTYEVFEGSTTGKVPTLGISKGDLSNRHFDTDLTPIFLAHGFLPYPPYLMSPEILDREPDESDFELKGTTKYQDHPLLLLRTQPFPYARHASDEIWVNTSHHSSIERWIQYAGTEPSHKFDIAWAPLNKGWWPTSWSATSYTNKELKRINRLKVESRTEVANLGDADFTIGVAPGMHLIVEEIPQRGSGKSPMKPSNEEYDVSPSGQWVPANHPVPNRRIAQGTPSYRWEITTVIGLSFIAVLSYFVYRRKRAS